MNATEKELHERAKAADSQRRKTLYAPHYFAALLRGTAKRQKRLHAA